MYLTDKESWKTSHPWISFDLDLAQAGARFWMLLGEARSKCDHIRYVPLAEETARILSAVYFAKGVNATTAIEGNTLSEDEVLQRLAGQLELPASKEYLGKEIDNMISAYNEITKRVALGQHIPIGIETLCQLNREILDGLELQPGVEAGKLRHHDVAAGPYRAAPHGTVPELLRRLCEWLEGPQFETPQDDTLKIPYAFIKAVVAHVYVEWIHPFGDGNGRLGRLVEFTVLISSGVPLPAAHILTSHYNDTRTEYYRQLNEASRNGGDLRGFLNYAAQGFVDGLTAAIKLLHEQQERLMWQALVDERFARTKHSPSSNRQRLLALAMGVERRWFSKVEARRLLPDEYAGLTIRAVTRDLNRLRQLGFVIGGDKRFRANLALVRGMRPFVVDPDE
jgi:Fic family protein